MTVNPQPKPERIEDSEYKKFVRSHPCCLPVDRFPHMCTLQIEADHVPFPEHRGLKSAASKLEDYRCVPVCWYGHRYNEAHRKEVSEHLEAQIKSLWAEWQEMTHIPKRAYEKPQKVEIVLPADLCKIVEKKRNGIPVKKYLMTLIKESLEK